MMVDLSWRFGNKFRFVHEAMKVSIQVCGEWYEKAASEEVYDDISSFLIQFVLVSEEYG